MALLVISGAVASPTAALAGSVAPAAQEGSPEQAAALAAQEGSPEQAAVQEAEEPAAQRWRGVVDMSAFGRGELEFFVTFVVGENGTVRATIDIPAQGARGVPLQAVRYDEAAIAFTLATQPPAVFEAERDGDAATGTLTQGVQLPLRLERLAADDTRGVAKRPQTPRPPFPYERAEVRVPREGFALAGTLTLPAAEGPHPAVVLLTGSGPQDRDETIFDHKPFLVWADALTRAGFAVLRLDDRGVGDSGGTFATATTEDFVGDALAAVETLAGRADVDSDRIALLGHSEGALVASLAAARSDRVAAIVLLAGPGLAGRRLLPMQLAALARAAGLNEDAVSEQVAAQEALFDAVLADAPPEQVRAAAERLVDLQLGAVGGGADASRRETAVQQAVAQVTSPWFRQFLRLDPAEALRRVHCPVLALNGTLDLQVPAEENLSAIAAALEAAGNEEVTTRAFAGLNHLFQHARTGLVAEYGRIEETVAPEVLEAVTAWLRQRLGEQ